MSLIDESAIVIVTGISASGKSTVCEALASRFARGVHVKGDIFRRMVVNGRAEMTAEPSEEALRQLRLRYLLATSTADAYFNAGFSVVVQDVVIGPLLNEFVAMLTNSPLYVVVLAPRADVVAEREASRAKTAYHEGAASIAALDHVLRHETPRIGMWLDTSDQTPEETVDEIVVRASIEARVD